MGINADRDIHLDGSDNCVEVANDGQADNELDGQGDACDQDDDNDVILDIYETNTGTFVSATDTGSDPLLADSDGDGFDDGIEVMNGTDPNDPASNPAVVPGLTPRWQAVLVITLSVLAIAVLVQQQRRREEATNA